MTPLKPEHADRDYPVAQQPRFSIRRVLEGYAYAANGNAHNPTPRYRWQLRLDGRLVDHGATKRELVAEVDRIGAQGYSA